MAIFSPRSLTRLQLHHVFMLEGRLHRVILVNESRAKCIPIKRKAAPTDLGAVSPESHDDSANISPNSELDIIGHWNPATESIRFIDPDRAPSAPSQPPPVRAPEPDDDLIQNNLL